MYYIVTWALRRTACCLFNSLSYNEEEMMHTKAVFHFNCKCSVRPNKFTQMKNLLKGAVYCAGKLSKRPCSINLPVKQQIQAKGERFLQYLHFIGGEAIMHSLLIMWSTSLIYLSFPHGLVVFSVSNIFFLLFPCLQNVIPQNSFIYEGYGLPWSLPCVFSKY